MTKHITIAARGHFIPCAEPMPGGAAALLSEHVNDVNLHVTKELREFLIDLFHGGGGPGGKISMDSVLGLKEALNGKAALIHTHDQYVLLTYLQDNYYTAEQVDSKVAGAFKFQGSCTYAELLEKPKVQGHVWQVTDTDPEGDTNAEYACNGTAWVKLGFNIDLSAYAKLVDVTAETNRALQAENALSQSILNESNSRIAADEQLQINITAEQNARIAAIDALTWNKEFITAEETKTLEVRTRYFATAKLTGTLPTGVADGSEIRVTVLDNGITTTITPSAGDTVNGASTPIALDHGSLETIFVYSSDDHNWIMY